MKATFDSTGYPTDETIMAIEQWPLSGRQSFADFYAFCKSAFDESYGRWSENETDDEEDDPIIFVATGGWSGNESVISAMQENVLFWMVSWLESRRGGAYKFKQYPIK